MESFPHKFSVLSKLRISSDSNQVQLSELNNLKLNQKVTVVVKVMSVNAGETLNTKNGKQGNRIIYYLVGSLEVILGFWGKMSVIRSWEWR